MKINFEDIWEMVIKPLEGETVYTLDFKKTNLIKKVTDNSVIRDSKSDSPSQPIPKEVFRTIYDDLMIDGFITRIAINDKFPKRFSSIVCTILAHAPNIGYELKPVRLFTRKNSI